MLISNLTFTLTEETWLKCGWQQGTDVCFLLFPRERHAEGVFQQLYTCWHFLSNQHIPDKPRTRRQVTHSQRFTTFVITKMIVCGGKSVTRRLFSTEISQKCYNQKGPKVNGLWKTVRGRKKIKRVRSRQTTEEEKRQNAFAASFFELRPLLDSRRAKEEDVMNSPGASAGKRAELVLTSPAAEEK